MAKINNMDLLLDLLKKITGIEDQKTDLETIRLGVRELKKNKRIDPELIRKMKKSKVFDPAILDPNAPKKDEMNEDFRDRDNQLKVDNCLIKNSKYFADEVMLADPPSVESAVPEEGWWDWVVAKSKGVPATMDWYEIIMAQIDAFNTLARKQYDLYRQTAGLTEDADIDDSLIWSDKEREEFLAIEKEAIDNDYDTVNGIRYDDIDGFINDDNMSDEEAELLGDEYLSDAEKAEIDKEIEDMSDEELDALEAELEEVNESIKVTHDPKVLSEALTRAERIKKKMLMRRIKAKIAVGRRRKAKRMHTLPELMLLARRRAELMLKLKYAKMTASEYKDAPVAIKQRVEDRVAKKQALVNRLAKKFLIVIRKKDREKLKKRSEKKE